MAAIKNDRIRLEIQVQDLMRVSRVSLDLNKDGDGIVATAPHLCIGEVEIRGVAEQRTELSIYYGEDAVQARRRVPYTVGWVDLGHDVFPVEPGPFVLRAPIRRSVRVACVEANPAAHVESVVVEDKHFEGPNPGSFACSDAQVNELWEMAAQTIRCCSQEFLEDGTGRDGMCWIGDCAASGNAALLVVDGAELLKSSLNMFITLVRDDGSVPSNALHAGGHQLDRLPYLHMDPKSELGNWVVANYVADYVLAMRDYLQWTDDADMRERCHESVRGAGRWCADTLIRLSGGGDPGSYLSDNDGSTEGKWWKSPGMLAAQLYRGADAAAQLAGDADLRASLPECRAFAEGYGAGEGRFADDPGGPPSCHATSAAVLAGLTPSTAELFADRNYVGAKPLVSGYAASQWLAAVARTGDTALVLEHLRRWWGPMLAAGSSTAWERVDPRDGSFPRADGAPVSQCHAWSGTPAALLPLTILGIECLAPGWRSVSIAPQLGPLSWAEASVPTPHGLIRVRAERDGNGALTVEKDLPRECSESRFQR